MVKWMPGAGGRRWVTGNKLVYNWSLRRENLNVLSKKKKKVNMN